MSVSQLAERLRSEHVVQGHVVVRGTTRPVGGVIVQAWSVAVDDSQNAKPLGSLGSALVTDGYFEIRYEPRTSEDGGRSAVRVSVLAPTNADGVAEVLAHSDVRAGAAPVETFVVPVDAERLAAAGLDHALEAAAASADPEIAAQAVRVEREREAARRATLLAEKRLTVDAARVEADERRQIVTDRVMEHLTGVSRQSRAWQRLVPPGEDANAVAASYQNTALENEVGEVLKAPAATYLALSPAELADLGTPPDPRKVEALLRATRSGSGAQRLELPLVPATGDDDPFADPTAPADDPLTPDALEGSIDDKVAELVKVIAPPESLVAGTASGQEDLARQVARLRLPKGPADVPAYYDFHRLEIAFEHVWEDARADGYVAKATELFQQAQEAGGDPARVLESTTEAPLRALSRELRIATDALTRRPADDGIGWIARDDKPGLPQSKPGRMEEVPPIEPPWIPPVSPLPPKPPPGDGGAGTTPPVDPVPPQPQPGYPFTLVAPGTVNFGLLVTYQQCFTPLTYQVGRLIGTRTLGPRESWSFTTRTLVRTSHNRKQIEASQQSRRNESEDTQRDEAEIVARTQAKTNFAMSTEGGYDLGPLGEGSVSTKLGRDAESSSQDTKRSQRTSARKAAQELRTEQRIELESTSLFETEATERREITNVNDARAMTLVFYELQRRYRVTERLHRVTPVALVGQRVPRPEEITEEWLLRHDWIIRRFLPDDSFEPTLTYLRTSAAGDRIIIDDLRDHMTRLRGVISGLDAQVASTRRRTQQLFSELQQYVNKRATAVGEADSSGWLEGAWESVVGSSDEDSRERLRLLEDAARDAYERAVRDEQDLRARLEREATALQVATDEYVKALAESKNRRVEVDRLIAHVRDYILHYMQGIWSYEHPDQRYFRHHTLMAPTLSPLTRTYALTKLPGWPAGMPAQPGKDCYRVDLTVTGTAGANAADPDATLAELVDLDSYLGCKANMFIYPLRDSNALTDYMMLPYLDAELGVRDPDPDGVWTLDEFTAYVRQLRATMDPADFSDLEPQLRDVYSKLLSDPLRNGEEVTVPSDAVYLQLLVDPGTVLEEFKERHREMDVAKVAAEVRAAELDNLRRAKLVLAGELDDPNIESVKNVYYHGPAPHDGDE